MTHRFQVVLTHEQYVFLDKEADRSGVSMAELIRRAIDTTYQPTGSRGRVLAITHELGRRSGRSFDARYFSPSK